MKNFLTVFQMIASLAFTGFACWCFSKHQLDAATFFLIWAVLLKIKFPDGSL
jgi:hypothetical protein